MNSSIFLRHCRIVCGALPTILLASTAYSQQSQPPSNGALKDLEVEFLESEIERYQDRYLNNENYSGDPPGLQIVIAGTSDFTRNVGCQAAQDARAGGQQLNELEESELCNGALSDRRAGYVYLQLEKVVQETGLEIDMREDVAWFGTSHFAARDASVDACIAAIAGVESVAELEPGQLDGLDLTPCDDDMNLRRVDNDFKAVFVTFR